MPNYLERFDLETTDGNIPIEIRDKATSNLLAQEIADRSALIKKDAQDNTVIETEKKIIETAHDKEENITDTYSRHVDGASSINVGGAATEVYAESFGVGVTGASSFTFTGGATLKGGRINVANDITGKNLTLSGNMQYKKPDKYNDFFDQVSMSDPSGNTYNLLVANAKTGSISAASFNHADIRNYGGTGNGIADDTTAFINCMAENNLVYLPAGDGLQWVLNDITLSEGQCVIGDGASNIVYKGEGDLFKVTGSYTTIYGLNVTFTANGNLLHMSNENKCEYIYVNQIVTHGATRVWYDADGTTYTNLYMHNVSGRDMRGTCVDVEHGFAFIMLDNVTADNLPNHASWPSFKFVNVEGAHLTHCEAEGGGVDGSNTKADGFIFSGCKAIWMDRCMSDLCDSAGIRLEGDANEYFYISNCVVSLCFNNAMLINGTFITITGCYINGRKGMAVNVPNANGIYSFGSNVTVNGCNVYNVTGYPLAFNTGNIVNCGNSIFTSNQNGIYLGGGVSGIVHDVLLINNTANAVSDASAGTCKYYYVYNGTAMLSNVT